MNHYRYDFSTLSASLEGLGFLYLSQAQLWSHSRESDLLHGAMELLPNTLAILVLEKVDPSDISVIHYTKF